MKIHLTESIFNRLLLTEATTEEIYQKYYTDIPYNTFCQIIQLDPTSVNGRMGKYTKWLLNIYRKGTFKEGDFGEAIQLLPIYDRYKNVVSVKDIMTLNSMGELYSVVQPYMSGNQATSKSDVARKTKEGAEKVYEDNQWVIIVPHTMEAAQLYGKHTKWCTAAEKSNNMFDFYNEKGPLFINIDKVNNRKYQFHFETNQYMDEEDRPLIRVAIRRHSKTVLPNPDTSYADLIGMPKGVQEFYVEKCGFKKVLPLIGTPNTILKCIQNGTIKVDDENRSIIHFTSYGVAIGKPKKLRILGWTTYVTSGFKSVNGMWFKDGDECYRGNYVNVKLNNDEWTYMDLKGEIQELPFNNVTYCSPLSLNRYGCIEFGNGLYNIVDADNSFKPVFKEPFTKIEGDSYFKGDSILKANFGGNYLIQAERNGELFLITVKGYELSFAKWGNELIQYAENVARDNYKEPEFGDDYEYDLKREFKHQVETGRLFDDKDIYDFVKLYMKNTMPKVLLKQYHSIEALETYGVEVLIRRFFEEYYNRYYLHK